MLIRTDILSLENNPLFNTLIHAFEHFKTDYKSNNVPYYCTLINQNQNPIDVIIVLVSLHNILIFDEAGKDKTDYFFEFDYLRFNLDVELHLCKVITVEVQAINLRQGRGSLLLEFIESYLKCTPRYSHIKYIWLDAIPLSGLMSKQQLLNFYFHNGYIQYPLNCNRPSRLYKNLIAQCGLKQV